jgi:hypothetical protein
VTATGVWVIDAKRRKGRPEKRAEPHALSARGSVPVGKQQIAADVRREALLNFFAPGRFLGPV